MLLYDAIPHGRKLLFSMSNPSQESVDMNSSSVKKVRNAVTPVQVVYDEAINNVEEVHYDAITYVCYDAVLSLNNVSSRPSYVKEAIQEFTYLFSSSSIVWNYEEN